MLAQSDRYQVKNSICGSDFKKKLSFNGATDVLQKHLSFSKEFHERFSGLETGIVSNLSETSLHRLLKYILQLLEVSGT